KQPVHEIVSLLDNNVAVPISSYRLIVDSASSLSKSTRALDMLGPALPATGVTPLVITAGHTYRITYTYNQMLYSLEDTLNLPVNHYDNRDVLAREQTPVAINVHLMIKPYTGQDFTIVANRVETLVGNYLEALD